MSIGKSSMLPATMIDVSDVTKRFGAIEVLRGVSLTIRKSEITCIIGSSGSGKSTLLRCMAFLEAYDTGSVMIEGELLGYAGHGASRRKASNREIVRVRRNVGFVFQQFNLWPHMTALQNVAMPLVLAKGMSRPAALERARATLGKVGLADRVDLYPSQLSGGQQQRCAIARAIAMEPHMILFDEPTSALDPELVGEVLQVMQDLAADGMTMAIVTHEMGFAAQVATNVVFLDKGMIGAQGAPAELFRNPTHPRFAQFLQDYLKRNAFWGQA